VCRLHKEPKSEVVGFLAGSFALISYLNVLGIDHLAKNQLGFLANYREDVVKAT
jgi:hypothetical protein